MNGTDWSRFRVERISWLTFVKRNLIHVELLAHTASRAHGSVLEVGIGSGAQSAVLSYRVGRVVAVDNNQGILAAARPNVERFGRGVVLVAADAFCLPFPDASFGVSISQGLMEHFDDASIGELLREQLRVCRSVVFSVPSDRYPRQDVGDERLMSPSDWRGIVARAVNPEEYEIQARYYRLDSESWKYSALAGRWLGGFSVIVTIDPR
jgi:ubiquinone/menaquinone biosynthesis C-methylase UbiE